MLRRLAESHLRRGCEDPQSSASAGQSRYACRTIDRMMTTTRPVLTFYGRTHCEPCAEARSTLQWVLEERASRGQLVPRVVDVDVSSDADLEARYGGLVPVVAWQTRSCRW